MALVHVRLTFAPQDDHFCGTIKKPLLESTFMGYIISLLVLFCQLPYNKEPVDGFVRELTFAKRLYKHFL